MYAPEQNGKENDSDLNLTDNICDPIILRNILEDICRDILSLIPRRTLGRQNKPAPKSRISRRQGF